MFLFNNERLLNLTRASGLHPSRVSSVVLFVFIRMLELMNYLQSPILRKKNIFVMPLVSRHKFN